MAAQELSSISRAITTFLDNHPQESDPSPMPEVMQVLGLMDKLRTQIEPPNLTRLRTMFSWTTLPAARIALGMGVFDTFARSGQSALSLDELDAGTKGDRVLLQRLLRLLAADHLIEQLETDVFVPSSFALGLASGTTGGDSIITIHNFLLTSAFANQHLEANEYKNPNDAYNGVFQLSRGTKEQFFDWLRQHPSENRAFNSTMASRRTPLNDEWFHWFPVVEKLFVNDPTAVALVDIGGGKGHDISRFKEAYPQLQGRMILQDLPHVIDDITESLPAGIESMAYDMFTPQPVKGAKVYYMRSVLHDWPDSQALVVLERIREAMDPEYSTLLLHENVLPDGGGGVLGAKMDFVMMLNFSSLERTELQWRHLLGETGFELVKVWASPVRTAGNNIAVLEARVR